MPDELRAHPGEIPEHLTIGGIEWVRIGVLLLVCLLVAVLWAQVHSLRGIADTIVDNQNQGRAFFCDSQARAGQPLADSCTSPDVLKYRETG